MYHLFAHNKKNLVKVGDKVKKYETPIGTIGKANGVYWAHLHFSISEGLSVQSLRNYVNSWKKSEVEKYFVDPRDIDFDKMFGRSVDVGKRGYDWLQLLENSDGTIRKPKTYHPGVDVNGHGGGDTDKGYEFTSSCDGEVIYVTNTNAKDGWGKMVIVEEKEQLAYPSPEKELREENKKLREFVDKVADDVEEIKDFLIRAEF